MSTRLQFERLEDRQMLSGAGLLGALEGLSAAAQNAIVQAAQMADRLAGPASLGGTAQLYRPGADSFESDDRPAQAKPIATTGALQTHTLDVRTDVDWVTFTLAGQSDVVIETRGTFGDTRMWLCSGQSVGGRLQFDPVRFDHDGGVGFFSRIICAGPGAANGAVGHHSLAAGTYYVRIDAAPRFFVPFTYTIGVTTLQPGDVFLVKSTSNPADVLISSMIRLGETRQLNVPYSATYFHSALYLGGDRAAEMLAVGFTDQTSLEKLYDHDAWIDVYRRPDMDSEDGQAVVDAIEVYQGTPYGFSQLGVFGLATIIPRNPRLIKSSVIYATYLANARGPQQMICSELVARAFAEAQTGDGRSLALSVTLWPSLANLGDTTVDFLMDFTSPTMLSLSPSLQRLNV